MYSQAAVSSASVAARAVLRWDGTPEKRGPGRPGLAGTFGGSCLWGCLSGSRVVRGSSSGASWRVGRGRFAGREASAVGGLLPARRRGLGACSSLPSGVAGAVCSVRLGLVRGASRRPWRRSFGWGGAGKGTSPGCAVGSCGGRTRPLVARVTRSVAIGAQRSQASAQRIPCSSPLGARSRFEPCSLPRVPRVLLLTRPQRGGYREHPARRLAA